MRSLALLFILIGAATTATPLMAAGPTPAPADTTYSLYDFRQTWLSRDKAFHLAGSAIGAAGVYALGRELGFGRVPSAIGASLVIGTIGVLRETFDADDPRLLNRNAFSRKDMAWNIAGIAIGISLTDLVYGRHERKAEQP